MRPVSRELLSAVTGSHGMVSQARLLTEFQTGVNPTGIDLQFDDGDVKLDASADVRGNLDLNVIGSGDLGWPSDPTDLLSPHGNEIWVSRGVRFSSGHIEMVSQGYYKIDMVDQAEHHKFPVRVSAKDRMTSVVEARLESPVQFAKNTTVGDIILGLVGEVYPDVTLETDEPSFLTGTIVRAQIADEDRYRFLYNLCRSRGKILYFDYRGVLVAKDPPNPVQPVLQVAGGHGGVLLKRDRRISREGVYNAVVCTGEAPDERPPARGTARDLNPKSPTYYHGPFGKVPRFFHSPLMETSDQCAKAAQTILNRSLGLPYSADFSMVPNPALEPYDPIEVRTDRSEIHILDTVTIPLVATEPLTASTRRQTDLSDLEA